MQTQLTKSGQIGRDTPLPNEQSEILAHKVGAKRKGPEELKKTSKRRRKVADKDEVEVPCDVGRPTSVESSSESNVEQRAQPFASN